MVTVEPRVIMGGGVVGLVIVVYVVGGCTVSCTSLSKMKIFGICPIFLAETLGGHRVRGVERSDNKPRYLLVAS